MREPIARAILLGLLALAPAGCASLPVPATASPPSAVPVEPAPPPPLPPERLASRFDEQPCEGPTAVPPEAQEILAEFGAPEGAAHCELHRPLAGAPPLLFVRTMNTVAHLDDGSPSPACSWQVFRIAGGPIALVASLERCELRMVDGCVYDLDERDAEREVLQCFHDPSALPAIFERSGAKKRRRRKGR